jgi:hypothetical protein
MNGAATTNADSFHVVGRADGRIVTSVALQERLLLKRNLHALDSGCLDVRLVSTRLDFRSVYVPNIFRV